MTMFGHFGSSWSFFGAFGAKDSIVNNSTYRNFFPIELHIQKARYACILLTLCNLNKYSPEVVHFCTSMGNVPIFERTWSIFVNNSL